MAVNNLTIKINGDTADFQKALGQTEKSTKKLQQTLTGIATKATIAFAGLSATIAGLIATYRVQEQAETRLGAALKSTGNAVGLTAKELTNMASSLQEVSTFGDEAIIGAQSLLLTFTKIGKDVFPKATETVLDMSAALGTDLKSSALMLGKALNDPILGITAMTRAGIQFSEEQKDLVKSFVKINDVASAQAIILKELQVQFGGQARATAEGTGRFIQLGNTLGDIAEIIGKKLTKPLSEMAHWLNEILVKLLKAHGKEFSDMAATVLLFATNLAALTAGLATAAAGFYGLRTAITAASISLKGFRATLVSTGIGALLIGASVAITTFMSDFVKNIDRTKLLWKETVKIFIKGFDTIGITAKEFFVTIASYFSTGFIFNPAHMVTHFTIIKGVISDALKKVGEDFSTFKKNVDEKWNDKLPGTTLPVAKAAEAIEQTIKYYNKRLYEEQERYKEKVLELLGEEQLAKMEMNQEYDEMFRLYTEEERLLKLEELSKFILTEKELEKQAFDEKQKKRIKDQNDELKFEQKHNLKLTGGMKAYYKTMKVLDDNRFKEAKQFASQFAGMASSKNKELRAIAKVGANVSIVANTVAAASSAMKGAVEFFGVPAGPIIGAVLAAAQIAFGVEQIHTLNAQKLADGGIVSGGIKGIDSVPAMLMPGELVIPQRDANDALNSIGASRDEEVFGNDSTTQVIIGFDGEEASQVLTARQIENQALGISREEAA